jgi:DnaJ-class molecular chaperone
MTGAGCVCPQPEREECTDMTGCRDCVSVARTLALCAACDGEGGWDGYSGWVECPTCLGLGVRMEIA